MAKPTNSFNTLAGVPVHYARPPVAPYGTRGAARRFLATAAFERKLDTAFGELWTRCPLGPAEVIVTAGAWVAKPGYHGLGRGFDLDALFWSGGRRDFITVRYPQDTAFYLAVEGVLRRHFGTVLQYHYDRAHEDHFHLDDGTPVGWNRRSRSRVLYLQAALTHLHGAPVEIDGIYGQETARTTQRILRELGLDGSLEQLGIWKAFLAQSADRGFALALENDPPVPPSTAPQEPLPEIALPRLWSATVGQVGAMAETMRSQLQRLEQQVAQLDQHLNLRAVLDGQGKAAPPLAAPKFRFSVRGKMSTFGGPEDRGVKPDEGLALIQPSQAQEFAPYFLQEQPRGTTGLARRLDPNASYLACRWDYLKLSKAELRDAQAVVRNPATGAWVLAQPVDWGPAEWTGRVADLSPGLARVLALQTDDEVEVEIL